MCSTYKKKLDSGSKSQLLLIPTTRKMPKFRTGLSSFHVKLIFWFFFFSSHVVNDIRPFSKSTKQTQPHSFYFLKSEIMNSWNGDSEPLPNVIMSNLWGEQGKKVMVEYRRKGWRLGRDFCFRERIWRSWRSVSCLHDLFIAGTDLVMCLKIIDVEVRLDTLSSDMTF